MGFAAIQVDCSTEFEVPWESLLSEMYEWNHVNVTSNLISILKELRGGPVKNTLYIVFHLNIEGKTSKNMLYNVFNLNSVSLL